MTTSQQLSRKVTSQAKSMSQSNSTLKMVKKQIVNMSTIGILNAK